MTHPNTIGSHGFEPDYHRRFRGEFGIHFKDSPDELQFALAFIDEENRKAKDDGYAFGLREGRAEERAALIEKVEGMKWKGDHHLGSEQYGCSWCMERRAANKALDDLLTHLQGETNKPKYD